MQLRILPAMVAVLGTSFSGPTRADMILRAIGPTTIPPGGHVDFMFAASFPAPMSWTWHLGGDSEPGPVPFGEQFWYRGSRIDHSEWSTGLSVTATSTAGGSFSTGATATALSGYFSMSFPSAGDFSVSAQSRYSATWIEATHADRAVRSCFLFICGPWNYWTELAGERSGGYGYDASAGPIAVHVVPETETWALMAAGLGVLGALRRRRPA